MINDYFQLNETKKMIIKAPNKLRIILWFWLITILFFLIWASFTKIDEIVRGEGKIIPSGKNQIIQNLEGGIIKNILVREGDSVKAGETLIQIQNEKSFSSYEEKIIKIQELENKIKRLKAQSRITLESFETKEILVPHEKNLFLTNIELLKSKINIFKEQKIQEKANLKEAQMDIKHYKKSRALLQEESDLLEPLVSKGIRPKIDLLRLKQELNDVAQKLDSSKESIKRIESSIKEIYSKSNEVVKKFNSQSQEELNKYLIELQQLKINTRSDKDSVLRTEVKAPSNGIIQNVFIHTIGGVIKPGENLIEIVPTDDSLLVEAKINPADIGFIFADQKVIVKVSAYDFSIYGGLEGNIVKIGADTQVDKDGNSYYEVLIKTKTNFLGSQKLPIIPGMVVSIDILTGKKSILDYILKPILKTKQYTFTER
jgi:adhesin transport system membrane fusion protein